MPLAAGPSVHAASWTQSPVRPRLDEVDSSLQAAGPNLADTSSTPVEEESGGEQTVALVFFALQALAKLRRELLYGTCILSTVQTTSCVFSTPGVLNVTSLVIPKLQLHYPTISQMITQRPKPKQTKGRALIDSVVPPEMLHVRWNIPVWFTW